jgi:uncharacterized protein
VSSVGKTVMVEGEPFQLLAERALFWPRTRMLIVADLHLAKADVFRARGIPIPTGTTAQTLQRLETLLKSHQATQLLVLGDFLHAKESVNARAIEEISAWRTRWSALSITVVEGNHDRSAKTGSAALDISLVDEPFVVEPFAFRHERHADEPRFQFTGHVHPYAQVRGAFHRARVPCFVFSESQRTGVLPAFGAFTGGVNTVARDGETRYACVGETVVPL